MIQQLKEVAKEHIIQIEFVDEAALRKLASFTESLTGEGSLMNLLCRIKSSKNILIWCLLDKLEAVKWGPSIRDIDKWDDEDWFFSFILTIGFYLVIHDW